MKTIIFSAFMAICLLSCYAWAGPSFNCSKAKTKIEHAICESSTLIEYDNLMGKMYRELKNIDEVKNSQGGWVKKRNTQCSSGGTDCLIDLYRARLLELDEHYSPSEKNGKYVMTGGKREITIVLSSDSDGSSIKLDLSGSCDFHGIGQLNNDEVIVRDDKLPKDAFIKIVFHNKLIEVSSQGSSFCGVGSYVVDGLYLLTTNGRKGRVEKKHDLEKHQKWYEGGTLHHAKGGDWRTATQANRLATSADFIATLRNQLVLTIRKEDDFKAYATELSNCLTEFLKTEQTDNQSMETSALMCVTTMNWLKK